MNGYGLTPAPTGRKFARSNDHSDMSNMMSRQETPNTGTSDAAGGWPSVESGRFRPLGLGLKLVWESSAGWTVLRGVLILVQGLVPLAALYLLKRIVDAIGVAVASADPTAALGSILWLVAAAAGVGLAGAGARIAGSFVTEAQALTVTEHVVALLQAKSVEVDLQYYEDPRYHDTLHRAQEQAPHRPAHIVQQLASIGLSSVTLAALAALLLAFAWWIPALLLAAALPTLLVRARFATRTYDWQRKQTPAERQARYLNAVLTAEPFAKEVRLFGLGPALRDRFRAIQQRVRRERIQLVARRTRLEFAAFAAASAALFIAFATITVRALQRAISLGDLVMYFGALQRAQDAFRDLVGALAALHEDNLFLGDLAAFFALAPRVREAAHPTPLPRPLRSGITFDRVSFHYPGAAHDVLRDVSFTIAPGEHVALVGENGSGKTTLVKLLCRLYDPTAGAIRIDDLDLRDLGIAGLRREIGVLFQDYVRYQLTAAENIALGDLDRPIDATRIADAARRTGADVVIARLRDGYDTQLGRSFADGAELSVGEWQKIALARAFLRDARILIMDEPTSALDAWAEVQVYEHFHQLARGRTAILISHRLSAMRAIDRIFVLDAGRIVECGSHDELVAHGGTYARLFDIQARPYR